MCVIFITTEFNFCKPHILLSIEPHYNSNYSKPHFLSVVLFLFFVCLLLFWGEVEPSLLW